MSLKGEPGFFIFDKPCDECLHSDNRIVTLKRKEQIEKGCVGSDTHFICHKASQSGDDVACRSHMEKHTTNLERQSGRIGMVFLVNLVDYLKGVITYRKPEPGELRGKFTSKGRVG